MGLTIHWTIRAPASSAIKARRLLEQLRQRALELPFESVGDIVELRETDCHPEQLPQDDPRRCLLLQGAPRGITNRIGDSKVCTVIVAQITTLSRGLSKCF
jgi:hypothetical protein